MVTLAGTPTSRRSLLFGWSSPRACARAVGKRLDGATEEAIEQTMRVVTNKTDGNAGRQRREPSQSDTIFSMRQQANLKGERYAYEPTLFF
jgi:hypothetical protein